MSLALGSRALYRSFLYRYGHWHQTQSRLLCKGPPDDTPEIKKDIESVAADKQVVESVAADKQDVGSVAADKQDTKTIDDQGTIQDEKKEKMELSPEPNGVEPEKSAKTIADEKRAAARKKLNELLISLATTDPVPVEPVSRVELSKPKARPKAVKKKKLQEETSKEDDAVSPPPEDIQIEPELVAATKDVAESLGGDVKATESELLTTLRSHASESSVDDKPTTNLSELFVGMKVERSRSKPVMERQRGSRYDRDPSGQQRSSSDEESRYRKSWSGPSRSREQVHVDLFGSKTLGIFDVKKLAEGEASIGESVLPVWDTAHRRELELSVTHPPHNAFIEMIQWTKQGKFWTFPIDNEFGLEEEKKVGFHEHVFLEHHLADWCPKRGPVRHFMELVCVGLSKNPHLTVERKRRHIEWYKDYFEAKQDILKEIGAIEAEQ